LEEFPKKCIPAKKRHHGQDKIFVPKKPGDISQDRGSMVHAQFTSACVSQDNLITTKKTKHIKKASKTHFVSFQELVPS
jgi:hypothetical protein